MIKKILAFLAIAAVGVVGIIASRDDDGANAAESETGSEVRADESADSPGAPAGVSAGSRHYSDLDRVKTPGGLPSQEKSYTGFRLSFNSENHTPNWVAWELLGTETDGASSRGGRKFFADEELDGCPDTRDYTRSGFDRGHMCPAADQKWSAQAMEDCFVMANICPQDHSLNSGAWNSLEQRERAWALRDSAIVIVAGPIYQKSDTQRIGSTGVRVPSAFFKVIAAPYAAEPRGIAFVYPNMTSPGNMEQYAMTIDDVEKLTGFDFFYSLPDDVEEKVESAASFREWNKKR